MELILAVALTLLLGLLAAFASGPLRIALGVLVLFFFPGYCLVALLFPRKGDLDGVQRIGLSLGLSIAVVPLLGLIIMYSPWRITLFSMLAAVTIFIVIAAGLALYRRRKLPEEERFQLRLSVTIPQWRKWSGWEKAISLLLVVAVSAALGVFAYALASPKIGARITDFYLLGPAGETASYPTELKVGEEGRVILGIANHEYEHTTYRVQIEVNGERVAQINPVSLPHGEKWEQEVSFTATEEGENQKVTFLLYKGNDSEPCRSLHLSFDAAWPSWP